MRTTSIRLFVFLFQLLGAFFGATFSAYAQRVESVKADRVLITTDSLAFKPEQKWEILGDRGEKTGEIKILQVREDKAVGQVTLGFANAGFFLRLIAEPALVEKSKDRRMFIGPSYLGSTADLTLSDGTTATLKGAQMGLQLGADRILVPHQLLRLRLGTDLVNTMGSLSSASCSGVTDCRLWIHYLTASLGFLFLAQPVDSNLNVGISTAFVGLLPISRNSNAIDSSTMNVDGGLEAGALIEFKINPITWIQFSGQLMDMRKTTSVKMQMTRYNLMWMQYF